MTKKGQKFTPEHCRHISEAKKGKSPWNKGKKGLQVAWNKGKKGLQVAWNKGISQSQETKKKLSEKKKGKPLSLEHREHMSEAHKGKPHPLSAEARRKIGLARRGRPAWNKGRPHSLETRRKLSEYTGSLASNWREGISFFPYCPKFNNSFKERVRAFFGNRCFECGKPQSENMVKTRGGVIKSVKLHVHHVHYNKKMCCDGSPQDVVPLCTSCHAATSAGDRDYWEKHFTKKLYAAMGGKCFYTKEEYATLMSANTSTDQSTSADSAGGAKR
jgi:hypothetical protein